MNRSFRASVVSNKYVSNGLIPEAGASGLQGNREDEIPGTMQGRSLVAGMEKKPPEGSPGSEDKEKIIRDRLAGLGYI